VTAADAQGLLVEAYATGAIVETGVRTSPCKVTRYYAEVGGLVFEAAVSTDPFHTRGVHTDLVRLDLADDERVVGIAIEALAEVEQRNEFRHGTAWRVARAWQKAIREGARELLWRPSALDLKQREGGAR
jgi:hypothetical protein